MMTYSAQLIHNIFEQRCQKSWCIGLSQEIWIAETQRYLSELSVYIVDNIYPRIMLAHREPEAFLAGFMAAAIAECPVFLSNPNWSPSEWQQVSDTTKPHLFWGNDSPPLPLAPINTVQAREKGWILIPTGGTSGSIKFAIHTWETLSSAVSGFCLHFFGNVTPVNSCCCLPLHHVSGLMQFMRSLMTGGEFAFFTSEEVLLGRSLQLERDQFLNLQHSSASTFFLSLVPTQLWRLLQNPTRISWLQQFFAILVGGGATTPEVLQQAREYHLNLAPTYGMTEMAAQVSTLLPKEFHQGNQSVGHPLPHAEISIFSDQNIPLPLERTGEITILSSASFNGYYPEPNEVLWYFHTGDMGYFDASGFLHVLGRSDRRITTGGEKVFPEEVEAAIRATGLVEDVYVVGRPDAEWGQAITAFYVPIDATVTGATLKAAIANQLSAYKYPKHWQPIAQVPRNAQGKVDLDALDTSLL
jgi:O-succinylbenzoic acid--CoA ligase